MRDPVVREQRWQMLGLPHMVPLATFAESLRGPGLEVPDFDPFDGGVQAEILFLFEKPGPMTAASKAGKAGSGFISRDNDDPTAEATFNFMKDARIPRAASIVWNVIPGWNGTRAIAPSEVQAGVAALQELLRLLPCVRAVVLVGKRAEKARPLLVRTGLAISTSSHPSPLVRASQPDRWAAIPEDWARAWRHVAQAAHAAYGDLSAPERSPLKNRE